MDTHSPFSEIDPLVEEALRKSEERFSSFMAHLPGVAFIKDSEGKYLFANDEWELLFGYSSADALGKTDAQLFSPEIAQLFRINELNVINSGKGIQVYEQITKDNQIQHWLVSRFPIRDRNKKVYRLGGIGINVTREKESEAALLEREKQLREVHEKHNAQLEQRIAQRTAQLESANEEIESFSYSVSHDLRAPLRGINGFAQALIEHAGTALDETSHAYLNRVCKAADKMALLIDDLLILSRLSRREIKYQQLNLSLLVQSIIEELQQQDPERSVEVLIQPGVFAHGDSNLLRILLQNLLSNAWKFTSKNPNATIEWGVTERPDQPCIYYVKDNGVGFDMQYSHKLFGAFQRLHSQSEFPGSGIGLTIVKRIVKRHLGTVRAEAVKGTGATFYFQLGTSDDPAPKTI